MGGWVQGCAKGTPDFLFLMLDKNHMPRSVFIEAKSEFGQLRPEQKAFRDKYKDHPYISVLLVRDIKELDDYIEANCLDRVAML